MADDRMAALERLRKAADDGDLDFLKEGVAVLAQLVMDAEVSTQIGAARGERAPERRLSQRTATASDAGTRASAASSCRSPSCATGATSRACSSRAAAPSARY